MTQFRAKPIIIEAMLWEGGAYDCLERFCGRNWNRADAVDERGPKDAEQIVVFNSLQDQWLNVPVGHWIVRDVRGSLSAWAPEVFEALYEVSA